VFGATWCLVLLVTKRDRSESTPQGRVKCEHYWLSVLMSLLVLLVEVTLLLKNRYERKWSIGFFLWKKLFLFSLRENLIILVLSAAGSASLRDEALENRHVLGRGQDAFRQSLSRSWSSE
jgi:hypothetical protein